MKVLRFGIEQEAVVEGNGSNKKKKRKRIIIWSSIGVVLLLLIGTGVVIASSGGTKIDPSKLAKVEKGDLARQRDPGQHRIVTKRQPSFRVDVGEQRPG